MKKTLFLVAIAAIIFSSCKKEHGLTTKASSAKKYAVTFNVSNFKRSQGAFALRTKGSHLASSDTLTNLASYVDRFYYVVADGNNYANIIKIIAQDSTMANMGMITDSLPAGSYYIAMIAGKNGLQLGNEPYSTFYTYGSSPWQDTFQSSFQLTIGARDTSLTTTLNRVVGKLEIAVQDIIPANADSLFITIDGDADKTSALFSWSYNTRLTTFPISIPASAKGQPNFTVDRLSGAIYYPVNVTIICKDAGGNVLGSTMVNSVAINANQKTILSGDLFTAPGPPQSFTVQVDTAWSSSPLQGGFSLKHH